MKKRILSILLSIIMIVGVLPIAAVPAFAEGDELAARTLQDIIGKVEGTYSGILSDYGEASVTITISEYEYRIEVINASGAYREIIDNNGRKIYNGSFVNGRLVFADEPGSTDIDETMYKFLNTKLETSEDENTFKVSTISGFAGGSLAFYDEQNGKTQKLLTGSGTVLNRIYGAEEGREYTSSTIPTAFQNTSWKGTAAPSEEAEPIEFILQFGTDSAYFTYQNKTVILPFYGYILGQEETVIAFKKETDEGAFSSLTVSLENGNVLSIKAQFITVDESIYMESNDEITECTTLRDILGKIGGFYIGNFVDFVEDSERNVTTLITIDSDELCYDTIISGVEAYRRHNDHDGFKEWYTETFENGQPVFDDEPDYEHADTVDLALSDEVELTEEAITLENGCVIPAGSYYVSETDMAFYGEQNGKTQMLYTAGLVAYRKGNTTPKTLRDIIDKVGGTYSSNNYLGISSTLTISSDEFRIVDIYPKASGYAADMTIVGDTGTKGWYTETFVNGQPVFDDGPGEDVSDETIEMFLSSAIGFTTEATTLPDGTVIPVGSYIAGASGLTFYDEQNNKTQKAYLISGQMFNRVVDTEPKTLRDIIGKVGGTYSGINSSGTSVTVTINSNEFSQVTIYSDGYAERAIVGNTGTKIWYTETFVNGQPVFDDENYEESEDNTIETILNLGVEILTEDDIGGDVTVLPAGSYVVGEMLVFYNEQNGVTQNSLYLGAVLNRIGGAEHEHTFSEEWNYNELTHWHDATCEHTGFVSCFAEHTFGNDGKCTVCGYEKTAEEEHTHTYGEATYIWNEDLTKCTAIKTCECGLSVVETVDTVKNGNTVTATFTTDGFTEQEKIVEEVEDEAEKALKEAKTAAKAAIDNTVKNEDNDIKNYGEAAKGDIDELTTITAVTEKLTAALSEINAMKTQKAKAAALLELDNAAKNAVAAKSKAIAQAAKQLIENAKSADEANAVLSEALTKIAGEEKTLANAKTAAKAVIDSAAGSKQSDEMKKIVSEVKADIDSAKSLEEVENAKQAGLARIEAQKQAEKPTEPDEPTKPSDKCPKCGGTHADNFWGQIVCFFNRIGNWFRNLFNW